MRKRDKNIIIFHALFYLVLGTLLLAVCSPVEAGPFLKINRIDAESEYPSIKIFFSASGVDHSAILGLGEENITVYEDGYRVNYVKVSGLAETKDFFYFVFSIDASRSITKKQMARLKRTAKELVNAAGSEDRMAIYRFDNHVKMISSFTSNKGELVKGIDKLETRGSRTLLFNSLYDSIDMMSRVEGYKREVIVFTDGKDEGSSVDADDVVKYARDNTIPVHFVCFSHAKNRKIMGRIAKLTGGRLYCIKDPEAGAGIYSDLSRMTRSRYIALYKSILKPDGKTHHVELRMSHGEMRDRDGREIILKKRSGEISLPSLSEIILILLIILLVILIIVILVFFLRKGNRMMGSVYPLAAETSMNVEYQKTIVKDEEERKREDRVLLAGEAEYSYARAWLVEKDGPEAGKKFPIFWEEVTLGREEENTVVIRDQAVSLKHAKIKRIKNVYYLFDIVSDNGTFVNGNKLLRPRPLYDWDEIRVGRSLFIFRGSKIA